MATFDEHIKITLSNACTRVHLSTYISSLPNRILGPAEVAVLGNFVRIEKGRPVRTQLILGAINGVQGHAGENGFHAVEPFLQLLQELRIDTHNIGALVTDNSTINDALCHALERSFKELYTPSPWVAGDMRVRCLDNIINPIVKSFFLNKEILTEEDEEKQDKTIIDLIAQLSYNQSKSLTTASQENTPNHPELQRHFLTNEDWGELGTIRDPLRIFHDYEATLRADLQSGSVGQHLIILNLLSGCINERMVSTTTIITTFIIARPTPRI